MPVAPLACAAPWTSLHLDPRGTVHACCENQLYELGSIRDQTLTSIWTGDRLSALRGALRDGDSSRGCGSCGAHAGSGHPERAWARTYDGLPSGSWPRRLELELSNVCNLQCVQCNGELSSSIRVHRERRMPLEPVYGDDFFDEIAGFVPHLEQAVFLGGEPFLGREPMRMFELLARDGPHVRCHVTTNGTIWNHRVERLLDRLDIDVSVSIDAATAERYGRIRVGAELLDGPAKPGSFLRQRQAEEHDGRDQLLPHAVERPRDARAAAYGGRPGPGRLREHRPASAGPEPLPALSR